MSSFLMIGMTDPGMLRTGNEDNISTRPEAGLAVLADGMGGHNAGEVASKIAVDTITQYLTDPYAADRDQSLEIRVTEAIRRANAAIHETARVRPECAGMGSTVVVALFRNGTLVVGHVGDSRLYRLRAGKLEQVTQDHSVIQELVNRGLFTYEEARQTVGKNLVTRALGIDPEVKADVANYPVDNDDIYLLCSDGLNDVVEDAEIERIVHDSHANLYTTAFRLVTLANQRGGPDNISVILVQRESEAQQIPDKKTGSEVSDDDGFNVSRHDKFFVGND